MRIPDFIRKLLWLALARVRARVPDYVIGSDPDAPYMRRWWVIPRNRWFNIYLHNVMRDDDDRALHDHPWPSLSLVLKGVLIEYYMRVSIDGKRGEVHSRVLGECDLVYRSSRFSHRLTLPVRRINPDSESSEVWTLFITGPRLRKWGFHCRKRWIDWEEFEAKGGCGEYE